MIRAATITIPLDGAEFQLRSFESVERLSELFLISLDGVAREEIDFLPHLGKPAKIEVNEGGSAVRYFHGLLTEAALTGEDPSGAVYRLTLRPWFYFLDQGRNYRIFQNLDVRDIAAQVFKDSGFGDYDFNLSESYQKREYCVQYKESDFAFLSRLFESEGIYYYFKHTESGHRLQLCDGKSAHPSFSGPVKLRRATVGWQAASADSIWEWSERVTSGGHQKVTLRSFDYTKPQLSLEAATSDKRVHPVDAVEVYEYLGDFTDQALGATRAKIRLQAARAQRRVFQGLGDVPGLACGETFKLSEASPPRFNAEYLVLGLHYRLDVGGGRIGGGGAPREIFVEALPADTRFYPLLHTPQPRAAGPETATITGPEKEVIHVDGDGRVKVRFHWDRSGSADEQSSCWMRVSHHSAGQAFGNIDLPRVGQEVLVDFLDGDPDRPIITGRVYNGQRPHAFGLPDNKTVSLWRTQTVGDAGDYSGAKKQPSGTGFNEICLEDKGGSEKFSMRAQRDMQIDVWLDETHTVQRDQTNTVGRDRSSEVERNEKLVVNTGDMSTDVKQGNVTFDVDTGNVTNTVKTGNVTNTVTTGNVDNTVKSGNVSTTLNMGSMDTQLKMGDFTLKCSLGQVTIEAMQSITLKVGQSTVTIDQTGVTVKGMMISSEAQTMNTMKGVMTQVQGSAMTTVKGGIVMIN